jgi:hypothetical protein
MQTLTLELQLGLQYSLLNLYLILVVALTRLTIDQTLVFVEQILLLSLILLECWFVLTNSNSLWLYNLLLALSTRLHLALQLALLLLIDLSYPVFL